MNRSNPLQRQLELERFLRAAEYAKNSCHGLKKLGSTELAYLNQLCLASTEGTWRMEPAKVEIPGHGPVNFSVISNPIARARDILGEADRIASEDSGWEGALFAYSNLVIEHLFVEGNRRTAALACYWILSNFGILVNPEDLIQSPVGNLRDPKTLIQFGVQLKSLQKGTLP